MEQEDPPRTSQVLSDLAHGFEGERISLGDIDAAMQDRAFGLLMLVCALPNMIPVSIPGVAAVTAAPLGLIGLQLLLGYRKPWLPDWLARRLFPHAEFARFTTRAIPWVQRLEGMLRPRLVSLTGRGAERFLIGGVVVILALALSLPIPFGNLLPGIAFALFALGLLERDGLAVLVGLFVAVGSLAVMAGVVGGGIGIAVHWLGM